MKSRVFIVLLLAILINSIVHAEEYSFDPETRILSTPYFSMELSDYWGDEFYNDDEFCQVYDLYGPGLIMCFPFEDKENLYSKEDIKEALYDIISTFDDIYMEYEEREYLDGYIKDAYVLVDGELVLFEGYCFLMGDNHGFVTLLVSNYDKDYVEIGKQTFKSDLATITMSDSQKVLVSRPYGEKYHKYKHAAGEFVTISLEEAEKHGYTPCQECYGD